MTILAHVYEWYGLWKIESNVDLKILKFYLFMNTYIYAESPFNNINRCVTDFAIKVLY